MIVLLAEARAQADRAVAGSMEGHAAMDMSVSREGSFWKRLASPEGFTSVAHNFVMEWAAVLRDIAIGLLIAGAVAAWIPDAFWGHLFFTDHPVGRANLGATHRSVGSDGCVRLLDRQRPAGGGAVERRDQLRRCGVIRVRRSDSSFRT